MHFPQRLLRQAPVLLGLIAVLAVLPGCPLSPDNGNDGNDLPPTQLPPRTTVDNAIEFYRLCWEQRLANEYREVLDAEFEFFPRDDDAGDFPWLQGDSWGLTDELAMADRMFDPELPDPGSSDGPRRVDRIEMTLDKLSESDDPDGGILVQYNVEAYVWFNSTDALHTVAKFEFLVVQDGGGLWKIRKQWEREPI